MVKIFIIVLVLLTNVISFSHASNQNDHFRSIKSGAWNSIGNWESSEDSISWVPATIFPKIESKSITIMSGDSIILKNYMALNGIKILSEGILTIDLSTGRLQILDDQGPEMQVYGKLYIFDSVYYQPNTSVEVKKNGLVTYHIYDYKKIHPFQWETGSTLKIHVPNKQSISCLEGNYSNVWYVIEPPHTNPDKFKISFKGNVNINGYLRTSVEKEQLSVTCLLSSHDANINIAGDMIVGRFVKLESTQVQGTKVNVNVYGNLYIENSASYDVKDLCTLNLWGDYNDNGNGLNVGSPKHGLLTFNNTNRPQLLTPRWGNSISMLIKENVQVTILDAIRFNPKEIIIAPNGSLITNNTIEKSIVQLEVPDADWTQAMSGWKMVSCPILDLSVTTGGFTYPEDNELFNKYDFYEWNEVQALWMNQKLPENGITKFITGKGYLCAYDEGGIKEFSGILNNTSVTFSNLSYTDNSNFGGYHLMGNPFSGAMDWNNPAWNRQNVCDVAQLWDSEAENYIAITEYNNLIPSLSGFFIQVLNNQNNIIIPKEARVHYTDAQKRRIVTENYMVLKVHGEGETAWDQTTVRLNGEALDGYDHFDGWKLEGSDQSPRLYTIIDEKPACVNSLSVSDVPESVPLGFSAPFSNKYVLEVTLNSIEQDAYLYDKLTGLESVLKTGVVYEFTGSPEDLKDRFNIVFGALGLDSHVTPAYNVFAYNSKLYIARCAGTNVNDASYQIFDLAGKLVMSGFVGDTPSDQVSLADLPHGAYVVRVFGSNNGVTVRKVIL